MILFFDTETTGVPKNYKAPVTDLENWHRPTQPWMTSGRQPSVTLNFNAEGFGEP